MLEFYHKCCPTLEAVGSDSEPTLVLCYTGLCDVYTRRNEIDRATDYQQKAGQWCRNEEQLPVFTQENPQRQSTPQKYQHSNNKPLVPVAR